MTSETEGAREAVGRKFDDIASLFGSIVPPPGSKVRPQRRMQPLPTALPDTLPEAAGPPVVPAPVTPPAPVIDPPVAAATGAVPMPQPRPAPAPAAAVPTAVAALPAPATSILAAPAPAPATPRPEPSFAARSRPAEIPWPDAFEPRPNYRKREPRNWSWLLLIPLGIAVAYGVSVADVRALRTWVDTTLLGRTPIRGTDSPLLPAPFRTDTPPATRSDAAPGGTPDAAATTTAEAAPAPAPASVDATPLAAAPEADIPYPAIPTSPVSVPPGTEVSPPPMDSAQAAAATAAAPVPHVVIQYRRNMPGAEGEARRIAALLQNSGGSVELRAGATAAVRTPTITYSVPADKPAAAALATTLANEAASWTVRLGTGKPSPGSLDVWMP